MNGPRASGAARTPIESSVLPVPALPKHVSIAMLSSSSASMKNCCSRLRARIGMPPGALTKSGIFSRRTMPSP